MSFASPSVLVALVAVPLAVLAYIAGGRSRLRFAERFARRAMLPNVIDRSPGWRRHVPMAILLLGLTTMLVGAARPRALVSVKRENATVVIAIDTSLSMAATDVRPSRLAAVKVAAAYFVAALPKKYRVGVVEFSSQAGVVAAATRNRALVDKALRRLTPGSASAIGDGIVAAIGVGRAVPREQAAGNRPAEVPPVAVVLFSDGVQEGGEVTAAQAVARARAAKVPVTTVVTGTPYGIIRHATAAGGFVQFIRVPIDPSEMRDIAKYTGGRSYVGPRTADLSTVYRNLKSRVGTVQKREELTFAFAIGAVAFLLAGAALSLVWLRRVP
jgi:Ca-activated chloride channel family protein